MAEPGSARSATGSPEVRICWNVGFSVSCQVHAIQMLADVDRRPGGKADISSGQPKSADGQPKGLEVRELGRD